ncbi:hypothetical protein BESB_073840 [Besnoitia besnoiti]|uniref:Maspardin n=1 Tax=Besnoitia besnoiti TaxID=94643 RepID=A0A2A9MFT6_BESBE|nr:uncharacterized protein BESB_073840 [Besnoitia besnoiti]PFH34232.1 hypothetical protein BESB_073840 [Besnoitia besnoiti]
MSPAYCNGGGEETRRRRRGSDDESERSQAGGKGECYLESFCLQDAFRDFQSRVPLKKLVSAQHAHRIWQWYELCGPEADGDSPLLIYSSPVVFLHGVNGTAAIYFQQLQALAEKGYRVLSVQWPALSSLASFLSSFDEFLTHILASPSAAARAARPRPGQAAGPSGLPAHSSSAPDRLSSHFDSVASAAACDEAACASARKQSRGIHLFGAGLGGLLCLYFAQRRPEMVSSVIVCNSFLNAAFLLGALAPLRGVFSPMFHLLPHAALRKIIIDTYFSAGRPSVYVENGVRTPGQPGEGDDEFPERIVWADESRSGSERYETSGGFWVVPREDMQTRNSKEFLICNLDAISAKDLAARLALQMSIGSSTPLQTTPEKMLIIQSLDAQVPADVAEELRNFCPGAKVAEIRDGGQFPFLSRPEEVTLHVQVHLRSCGLFPDRHVIQRQVSKASRDSWGSQEGLCASRQASRGSPASFRNSSGATQAHMRAALAPSPAVPQPPALGAWASAGDAPLSQGASALLSRELTRSASTSSDGGDDDRRERGEASREETRLQGKFADDEFAAQERWARRTWRNPFRDSD